MSELLIQFVLVALVAHVAVDGYLNHPLLPSVGHGSRLASRLSATGGNPGLQGGDEKPEVSFGGGLVGSSKDSGDIPEEIRIANLPKMASGLQKSLRQTVGELLSSKAVSTTSHYMKEFRNDADQRWMTSYKGFNANSFSTVFPGRDDSEWTDWFESMIKTDKVEIQVLMSAPKSQVLGQPRTSSASRPNKIQRKPMPYENTADSEKGGEVRMSTNVDMGKDERASLGSDSESEIREMTDSGIRIEYMHELEPRKIANQLLVVRESITKEVLMDLPCIRLECIEAQRYAKVKVEKGEEEAIKTIKMTRTSTAGGDSTPLRDRTYHDLSVISSNFALQMVYNSGDEATKAYLDAFIAELEKGDAERTVAERFFHEYAAPIEMLEELHFRGLEQGLASMEDQAQEEERKVNILKISQTLLDCRYAVSLEIKKIVMEDDGMTRQYYRMIKDNGGFKKFDMDGKGKIRLVNLNAKPGDEMYPTAPKSSSILDLSEFGSGTVQQNEDAEASLDKLNKEAAEAEAEQKVLAVVSDVTDDADDDSFGAGGPFLM